MKVISDERKKPPKALREKGDSMKILVIRLSSIGDIVLTQSVCAALAAHMPDAELHYLTKSAFMPLVESFGLPITVHRWETLQQAGRLFAFGRRYRFDLVIDLHNKFNTFLVKMLVMGKRTVTYDKRHFLRRRIVRHKTAETIHSTVDLYFSALRKAGITVPVSSPRLIADSATSEELEKLAALKHEGIILIGVFPGAQHATKQYPVAQLAEALNLMAKEYSCRFAVLGSPGEQHLAQELIVATDASITNFCGAFSLAQLVPAIQSVDVVVSNDSGPMHIAAALHKPQIAAFGATHPALGFAPQNDRAIVLCASLPCQPCSLHGQESCPRQHFNCMRKLSARHFSSALGKILGFLQ